MATSKKITELDQLTTAGNSDLLYIVNDPSNIPTSKKITVGDLLKNANSVITTFAATAYTNSVAYANTTSNTRAATAYSNAVTHANSVATAAYSNAVAYANSVATAAYNNAVAYFNATLLSPNIAYTGVFNGYPATIPITRGRGVAFTGNNFVLETPDKYWITRNFNTSDYDLSGTQTLQFVNIGGIEGYFRLGGKSETLLTSVNLRDIDVITDYLYLRDLPALTTFSANSLAYIGNYLQIDTFDNVNTQFNFPNLKTIAGTLYYTYNNVLENTPQFPALETVGNLYIYYNSATQNTMTFNNLRYASYVSIYQNAGMIEGPEFPALEYVEHFDLNSSINMTTPPTFPVLETVNGPFYFYGHDSLTTAPATPSLINVGYMGWYSNPAMVSGLNFSALKSVNGGVDFSGCALNETSVNYLLTTLAALDGTNGTTSYDNQTINVSGGTNAIPGTAGLAAIAILEGRGCTVNYNTP